MQKTAIVTGANRGIGFQTAKELAQKGFRVVLCARTLIKAQKAASELESLGLKVLPAELDVSSEKSFETFNTLLTQQIKEVHILVNNAGIYQDRSDAGPLSATPTEVQETFATNVLGPYRAIQRVLPLMKAQNFGRIVNVSSGMGQLSEMGSGAAAYRISKTALNALTKLVSVEIKDQNILVNSVCPGWVKTDMGGVNATRSLEQGASGIVWAATLPDHGPNGGFFRDGQALSW